MNDFNHKKYAFMLIAAIVAVNLLIVLFSVVVCADAGLKGIDVTQSRCNDGKLGEILANMMAVVLAIYAAKE